MLADLFYRTYLILASSSVFVLIHLLSHKTRIELVAGDMQSHPTA